MDDTKPKQCILAAMIYIQLLCCPRSLPSRTLHLSLAGNTGPILHLNIKVHYYRTFTGTDLQISRRLKRKKYSCADVSLSSKYSSVVIYILFLHDCV